MFSSRVFFVDLPHHLSSFHTELRTLGISIEFGTRATPRHLDRTTPVFQRTSGDIDGRVATAQMRVATPARGARRSSATAATCAGLPATPR